MTIAEHFEQTGREDEIKEVVINGVEYVPKTTIIPEAAKQIMGKLYGVLWTEGHYDPTNESTGKFARPLSDDMMELNRILKFRK